MALLTGGWQAVFGAAFAPLFNDGLLHRTTIGDDGRGGFDLGDAPVPIKVLLQSLSDSDRVAAGLPRTAVRLCVLGAGLPAAIALDDLISLGGLRYRVVKVDSDGTGASYLVNGVPS